VRLLDAGDGLWAVASTVAAGDFSEAALAAGLQNLDWVGRRAMAHEGVVEHFLGASAVLPMQMFTLFTTDERVLQHLRRDRKRLERLLTRVERQLEFGVRVTFDEQAESRTVKGRAAGNGGKKSGRGPASTKAAARALMVESGSDYLTRKRDVLASSRVQLADARSQADRVYKALSRDATDSHRRTATEQAAPGSRLLLDAAFLVPRAMAASFRAAVRRQARALDTGGLTVSLTGPWPPYNFIGASTRRRAGRGTAAAP
jgi:hypothetical protein